MIRLYIIKKLCIFYVWGTQNLCIRIKKSLDLLFLYAKQKKDKLAGTNGPDHIRLEGKTVDGYFQVWFVKTSSC